MRLPFPKRRSRKDPVPTSPPAAPGRAGNGDRLAEDLTYEGIAYRYDQDVVFLAFRDATAHEEGRPFTVWCAAPHRFAVRLDDGRIVDLTVDRIEGEDIEYRLHAVRKAAP